MERRIPDQFDDYMDILRRRWTLVAIPTFVAVFSMLLISAKLPKYYRSETVIKVDPQKVPQDIIRATVGGGVADRLQLIYQQVMSRTQLEKIIQQNGLYKDKTNLSAEELIELMRSDISMDIVADRSSRSQDLTAFKIGYLGRTPQQAMEVTRQLGSLFIEENVKVRSATAEGTKGFLEEEVEKVKAKLQVQEAKIKEFQSKYMGSLPEQQAANLQMAGQAQAMMQANMDALNRAYQGKIYLESQLEMAKQTTPVSPLSQQLEMKRNELTAVEQKYKEGHPDVVRLRGEVAALEEQVKASAPPSNTGQIRSQLAAVEQEIKERTRRQADLEARMRGLQGNMQSLPMVQQQYQELMRDYDVTKTQYQTLLAKQGSSSIAASMEISGKGEQFSTLDPASFPEKPAKPNMLQLNLVGLFAGLIVGTALAAYKEIRDHSIHTDRDLRHYVPAPVLGCMPQIHTVESLRVEKRKRLRNWALSGSAVTGAASVIGFLVYRGTINFAWWF
jgi:polysaccharide chain length determinant protein (PEP-CTERM system associated)